MKPNEDVEIQSPSSDPVRKTDSTISPRRLRDELARSLKLGTTRVFLIVSEADGSGQSYWLNARDAIEVFKLEDSQEEIST